jgi:hypothetical protein
MLEQGMDIRGWVAAGLLNRGQVRNFRTWMVCRVVLTELPMVTGMLGVEPVTMKVDSGPYAYSSGESGAGSIGTVSS